MNIFFLDENPIIAAKYHCDKHVIKMILESAQLLSTAHRVLDGKERMVLNDNGRRAKRWVHPSEEFDQILYTATHINHPSAVWVRESAGNYQWLMSLTIALNGEFIRRYNKSINHATIDKLARVLTYLPDEMPRTGFTPPPQCMPAEFVADDYVQGYRNYYMGAKRELAVWTNTPTPYWWTNYRMTR